MNTSTCSAKHETYSLDIALANYPLVRCLPTPNAIAVVTLSESFMILIFHVLIFAVHDHIWTSPHLSNFPASTSKTPNP